MSDTRVVPRSRDLPPLRGRDAELDLLRSRIVVAHRDGRGSVVVVSGAPGSGKSRLLQEVRLLAEDLGARIVSVAGDPDETAIPHGAILDAVEAGPDPLLDRELLTQMPQGPEQGWWLRQELHARLQEVAMQQPVLVCVDDLQWCAHGTLRLLRTVPAQLGTDAVVWVVAARSGAVDPAVTATIAALTGAGADRLDLQPLDSGAVALLVGDVLGAVPDQAVLASAARAEGHPLLLVELLRGWHEEQLIDVVDGRAQLQADLLPARLRDAVERRTERLSPAARQLLQVGSVIGRRFPPDLLAGMLDRPPPAILPALQEVIGAGLLLDDGEEIGFEHDLIREAVGAGIPRGFARVLRRHAVDVLRQRGAPPVAVAGLLAESALPGDLEAVAALREAAAGLVLTSSPAAADFSVRAMELLPEDSPLRPAVVAEAVQHLWQCGRSTAAQHLAATTLDRALSQDPAAIVPVRLRLATIFAAYSTAAADAQCRAALEHPSVPDDLRHQVLVFQAVNFGLGGDPEAGDEVLDLARRVEPASLDPQVELDLMRARAYIAFHRRQWAHAAQLHQDVIDASPDEHWLLLTGFWEMATSMSVGDTERALAMAEAEMAASRRAGRMGTLLISAQMRTRALYDAGRLEEAREQAGDVLEIDEAPPVGGLSGLLLYYALVRAALHEGRPDVLRAQREAVELMIGDASHRIRRNGLWLRALILDAAGDVEGALRAAAENIAMLGQPGPALSGLPDLEDEVILTRMALRAGERETAERAVAAAERRSADNPTYPMAAASARHARGLLDRDTAALREAVQLLGAGPRPLLLASAQEDLARQVAADRPREAIALLDEALRTCIEAGAEHDAARLRRRLRDLGVRRRRGPSGPGPAGRGLAALTPTEQEVVRLVVEGCTNRQVAERRHLSPHTVNTHLRNAFMKLGVRSRIELARLVAEATPW